MTRLPFRPGRLALVDQSLVRAAVYPSKKDDHLLWVIDVLRYGSSPAVSDGSSNQKSEEPESRPLIVITDLHLVEDGRLIGVTFGATVQLPPKIDPADVDPEALRTSLIANFGSSLWAASSMIVRQLAAMAAVDVTQRLPTDPPDPSTPDEVVGDPDAGVPPEAA